MPAINGHLLRGEMDALDVTPPALARAAGCSINHLREILAGNRQPSIELVTRMAAALKVTPDRLLKAPQAAASPLRKRRRAAGIKPGELAVRAGISVAHLHGLENGYRNPSPETLAALAEALGCAPSEIDGAVAA